MEERIPIRIVEGKQVAQEGDSYRLAEIFDPLAIDISVTFLNLRDYTFPPALFMLLCRKYCVSVALGEHLDYPVCPRGRCIDNEVCMLNFGRTLITSMVAVSVLASCASTNNNGYEPPRLPDGKPDLQGTWTNVSLTGLTRPGNFESLTVSKEEAKQIAERTAARAKAGLQPTDPNAPPPKKGTSVGGYNSFWGDSGEGLSKVNGEYRTSWIVEPKDGQLPFTGKGRKIFESEREDQRNHFDGPEGRPMAERCIIGFGSTGGPPMMNVMYNNNYQIVQNDDHVMILVEMNHDARIIRMNDEHRPASVRPWLGDSIGWWEGDTLVVETTNFNPDESLRLYYASSFYISKDATVTERFTRIADDEIFYEFEVKDPEIYTQPWRAEMALNAAEGPIYEYACHEGNYALPNILGGARQEERSN